jgi:hypothetical protein
MARNEKQKKQRLAYNKKYYATSIKNMSRFSEQELLLIWQHNINDRELSKTLNRSVRSIQLARHKIKHGIYTTTFNLNLNKNDTNI